MNFLNTFYGVLCEIWSLLAEMAPYLLFGFSIAGILHVLLPGNRIGKYLSGNSLRSIVRASLIGVPLPICSCGVIPVAAHIKKQGAGNAPTLSFLTSTPTTGVDSIMATYALLGPLFAIIRPVCAFFAGTLAGIMVRFSEKEIKDIEKKENKDPCVICKIDTEHEHTLKEKTKEIFRYAFKVLLQDVGKWLVIGIVTGGMISYFISTDFIERYLGNPFLAYPIMFLIAIPLYVCATGSIPIAASLILKGMSPGAGLVFLIAGPATNTATLSFVGGNVPRP